MLEKEASTKALVRYFRRARISELEGLCRVLETSSRMSVFRRLTEQGYLSSYTHTGKFYTLLEIPLFDENGLWFFQGVGFSRAGTLKQTIIDLVHNAETGRRQKELEGLLRIRVHNTLLVLVKSGRIGRERIEGAYLYVSAESKRAADQLAKYQTRSIGSSHSVDVLPEMTVIEVLSETLRAGEIHIAASIISARLLARGSSVSTEQVEGVFAQYGIEAEKKTLRSDSRPYRD